MCRYKTIYTYVYIYIYSDPVLALDWVMPRASVKSIMGYCRRFPQALVRQGFVQFIFHTYRWVFIQRYPACPAYPLILLDSIYIYIYYILDPCLGRKWKYNEDVEEFFVEDETTVKLKRADLTRQVDTTEMDDRVLVIELFF